MATLDPTARDQVHDMALAIRIREGTALSDGNRHPLLPAVLAPVARREPGFFDDAKTIAVALAGIVAFALFLAASRVYGAGLALLSLLAVLLELRHEARRICPEPLLAACLVAAASFAASGMGGSRAGARPGHPEGGRPDHPEGAHKRRPYGPLWFVIAGAWLGAAWLAKGSAILSVAATLVAVLFGGGRGGVARAGLVLAGFAVVASPLLVWNVSQGHGPTYNVNSAHVMWEDAWDVELDQRSEATPASWWARHGLRDAIEREAGGLGLLGAAKAQRGIEWLHACLAVIAVAAIVRRRRTSEGAVGVDAPRAWRRIAVASAIVWLLAIAWYAPIVASRRLLFPLFPVLVPPALAALGDIARAVAPRAAAALLATARLLARGAIPAAVVGLGVAVAAFATAPAAEESDALDRESIEAVRAMEALMPAGSRVLVRPSRTHPPDWLLEGRVRFLSLPGSVPDADAPAWIARETDATLLNEGLLRSRPQAFATIASWDDHAGVVPRSDERRAILWRASASLVARYALRASRAPFR